MSLNSILKILWKMLIGSAIGLLVIIILGWNDYLLKLATIIMFFIGLITISEFVFSTRTYQCVLGYILIGIIYNAILRDPVNLFIYSYGAILLFIRAQKHRRYIYAIISLLVFILGYILIEAFTK